MPSANAETPFTFSDFDRSAGEKPGTLVVEAWASPVRFSYSLVKCEPYSEDFEAVAAALREVVDANCMRFSCYNGELPSGWPDMDWLGTWTLEGGFYATE